VEIDKEGPVDVVLTVEAVVEVVLVVNVEVRVVSLEELLDVLDVVDVDVVMDASSAHNSISYILIGYVEDAPA
jgi:hypothetical protein